MPNSKNVPPRSQDRASYFADRVVEDLQHLIGVEGRARIARLARELLNETEQDLIREFRDRYVD
jgi:hypothetical protein